MSRAADTLLDLGRWMWSQLSFTIAFIVVVAAAPFVLPIVAFCAWMGWIDD